jgi:hypothetical protein
LGLFQVLPPGQYTAILNGKFVGTGIGLIEVYNEVEDRRSGFPVRFFSPQAGAINLDAIKAFFVRMRLLALPHISTPTPSGIGDRLTRLHL